MEGYRFPTVSQIRQERINEGFRWEYAAEAHLRGVIHSVLRGAVHAGQTNVHYDFSAFLCAMFPLPAQEATRRAVFYRLLKDLQDSGYRAYEYANPLTVKIEL